MCRSVSALSDTRWHTRSMRYVFGRRARALCSRGNGVRSLWAFFCGKKLRSRLSLFSRELGRSSAPRGSGPAAAEAVKRLSSRRLQMKLANEFGERGIFYLALESGWREWTAGGRCIVCYIFWSSRKCFAGSWCASRDVELLEVMKRALLLGKPTVDAWKRGSDLSLA